jgi:colanic acid/amylovoran biosynthesis glycosyltransferase
MASRVVALGCPEARVRVHPLGVDLAALPFSPRCWRRGEPLRVLMASSFTEKKGLPFGLAAVARMQAETGVDVRVCLVGGAAPNRRSRREAQRIEAAIAEHGLAGRVERKGYLSHARLHAIAAGCHVYLAPSVTAVDGDSEGGAPVGLIEMAASGMAVVSSRHCDIPAVVEHGATGWLAEERDVAGLAAGLRFWAESPDAWPPLLAAGRRRVEERFDAVSQGRQLAERYGELLETRGSRS